MIIEGQEPIVIAPKLRFDRRLVRDKRFPDSFRFKLILVWKLKRLRRFYNYDY